MLRNMNIFKISIFIGLFGSFAVAIRHRETTSVERRQSASFFPREDQMNFEPTASAQAIRFSNDLRDDIYQNTLQQGPQPIPPKSQQANYLNYGEFQQQPTYAPQQPIFQGSASMGPQLVPQFQGVPTAIPQSPQQQPIFQGAPNNPYFQNARPQSNSAYLAQQQYTAQQYAPQYQGANYGFAGPQQQLPLKMRRPAFMMYQPNIQRPQMFPLQPNVGDTLDGGGIVNSLQNFVTNIGQSAANFINPSANNGAAPASYRPPYSGQLGQQLGGQQSQLGQQSLGQFPRPVPSNPNSSPLLTFGKAIEEITRNDDFQCIPKVICQMVGTQRRLPPIFSSPIFSALIAAVPSTTSALVYGRAALLGVTAGEQNCHTAYPKCPRSEDDILYYLNNHRGGFFRFFNGGAAFGDDPNFQYNPNPYGQQNQHFQQQQQQQQQHQQQASQYEQQQQLQQQQSQTQSSLGAFQNLAELVNQGGGINLSNLGANADLLQNLAGLLGSGGGSGGSASNTASNSGFDLSSLASAGGTLLSTLTSGASSSSSPTNSNNINEVVGNLLTGFIGNRFSSRKLSKRSVDNLQFDDYHKMSTPSNLIEVRQKLSKKHIIDEDDAYLKHKRSRIIFEKTADDDIIYHLNRTIDHTSVESALDDRIIKEAQPRILNVKESIYAQNDNQKNHLRFEEENRQGKQVVFRDDQHIKFHSADTPNNRSPKAIQFKDTADERPFEAQQSATFFPQSDDVRTQPVKVKMVFDRTGTGNFRFDETSFQQSELLHRIGRILTGIRQQTAIQQSNEPTFSVQNTNRYKPQSGSNSNYPNNNAPNQNHNSNYNSNYNQNYPNYSTANNNHQRYDGQNYGNNNNRGSGNNAATNHNIYVTNSDGKTEYYIKPDGQKVYV